MSEILLRECRMWKWVGADREEDNECRDERCGVWRVIGASGKRQYSPTAQLGQVEDDEEGFYHFIFLAG